MFIFTDHYFSFESRPIIGTFMKIQNKILRQIVVFSLILISFSFAQKQLVIGAYGSSDVLNLHDTTSALSFNINTKLHGVLRKQADSWLTYTGDQNWGNNIPALSKFKSAAAGSLTASWIADSMRMQGSRFESNWLRNFDWIFYLSSAYHRKWSAYENSFLFYGLQLRHESGEFLNLDGIDYWTNRTSAVNSRIVFGPTTWDSHLSGKPGGYYQDSRYRGSGRFWDHDPLRYLVRFFIRRIPPLIPGNNGNDTLCIIKVKVNYSYYGTLRDTVWVNTVKYVDVNDSTTTPIYLAYDLEFIHDNSTLKGSQVLDIEKIQHLGTEFIVENKTTKYQYGVEEIEVYDKWIWEKYYSEYDSMSRIERLTEYLTSIRYDFTESPSFYDNKLDYAFTIDEPHSIDSHDAIRTLRESLQQIAAGGFGGLTKTPKLFIHFYPEWNGYRNNEFIPNRYAREVNPDPFVYYYHYDDRDPFNKTNRNLHYLLEEFDSQIKTNGFLFTIDVWDQASIHWCQPSKEALSAAIMMNLSYGSKGIIYEPFYSYGSVKGLVDTVTGSYQPTDLGYFVRDSINPRLAGKLGTTLAELKFNGDRVYLRNLYDTLGTVTDKNIGIDISIPNISQSGYFLVSRLDSDTLPLRKYVMVSNLESEGTSLRTVNFVMKCGSLPHVANLAIRDVEGRTIDKVINNLQGINDTLSVTLKSGDGSLLRVSPVVEAGGRVDFNGDTVKGETTLDGDTLFISAGKTLVVAGDYMLKNDLVIDSGATITGMGYLMPAPGIKINSKEWKNSLFRGKENSTVKLIWSKYPGTGTVNKYKIYRSKGAPTFQLIGSVGKDTLFYRDTTTEANNFTGGMEPYAKYFVVAEVNRNGRLYSDSTKDLGYYDFPSSGGPGGLEKKGSKGSRIYRWNIAQNYPNPFNPFTTINYELASETRVTLKLYDIVGREVITLVDEVKPAGEYQVSFDGSGLPSGVYIYRIETGKYVQARKLILLR
jgi:hypothetical protein